MFASLYIYSGTSLQRGPWDHENYLVISGFSYHGKKLRNIKSWDQQNYLVMRGFCYIRPLYNEVPLYFIHTRQPLSLIPPALHHQADILFEMLHDWC